MNVKIRDAYLRRGGELGRTVDGAAAADFVAEFMEEAGCTVEEMRAFWDAPDTSLGVFSTLPAELRQALAAAAHFSFVEEHNLSSPRLERAVHGSRAKLGYRLIRTGWRLTRRLGSSRGAIFVRLGRKLVTTARESGRRLLSETRFTRRYEMPPAYALWVHCGCDVLGLIQDYIEEIPVDRRFCPVWRSDEVNSESGMIVGLDMLMHAGEMYFVESNLNAAFHTDRLEFHPDGDPLIRNLVDYAVERGYTRIVFCPANVASHFIDMKYLMGLSLEEAWREVASDRGVEFEVVDSPVLGSPYDRKAELFMPEDARDTLFVNVRDLPSPLSRILGTKGQLEARFPGHNAGRPEAERVRFPKEIPDDASIPPMDLNPRFPNVIVKDTRLDMGRGLTLYKCRTLPPDANTGSRRAFEYIAPDCVTGHRDGREGDFVCNFRSYVMLTPDGPRYLSAKKNITSDPVPETLDEGLVMNKTGYISNLHLGGYTIEASAEEEAACRRFSMNVGALLCDILGKRHGSSARGREPSVRVRSEG